MKKFIKLILFVGCILYGLCWGLDLFISYKLWHNQDRKYVGWGDITQKQLNADVVIMGSSRAWVQYSPAIIDSVLGTNTYNLGIDGSMINRQVVKYKVFDHYQKQRPKYIILNIDYFTLEKLTIGYEREQFFPYMWNPFMREQILSVEPFSFAELYLPLYRYTTYKGLYDMICETYTEEEVVCRGYKGIERIWDSEMFDEQDSFHFSVNSKNLELFENFLKDRKNEGAKVIMCYSPIYIGVTELVDNLEEAQGLFEHYSKEYDCPILDYRNMYICSDTTCFYNATHLNKKGAELFSLQLACDLDSLGIISAK